MKRARLPIDQGKLEYENNQEGNSLKDPDTHLRDELTPTGANTSRSFKCGQCGLHVLRIRSSRIHPAEKEKARKRRWQDTEAFAPGKPLRVHDLPQLRF